MTFTSRGAILGLKQFSGVRLHDERGSFAKIMSLQQQTDEALNLVDMFWSKSSSGVIRGMHLQRGSAAGRKLVWVSEGSIRDVVLDLRDSSPSFLNWTDFVLEADSDPVLIPAGCAHGFAVIQGPAIVNYAQDCGFVPELDTGVRWDSFGYPWDATDPNVSARDSMLPSLQDYLANNSSN
jgi:dTDP-4-dehydrorhamnose 3,5-epimerase